MKKFNMLSKGVLFLVLLVLLGCNGSNKPKQEASLPYYDEATFTPHWLEAGSDSLAQFHRISPFRLINQEGDTITERSVAGKIYVTDFFFTSCPGICPKMTTNMALLQDAFREDDEILLISHSVTPEHDSVPVLQDYALASGVDARKWHLLTGDREQIYKLGRQDYFVEEDLGLQKDPEEFLHTENFVLIDQQRHIRGIYNGLNKASIAQLITDIHTLRMEQ